MSVAIAVAERVGDECDVAQAQNEHLGQRKGSGGVAGAMARAARAIATKARMVKLANTLAALGHPARVAMLAKLLEGDRKSVV